LEPDDLLNFFGGSNDPKAALDAMATCPETHVPFKLRPKFQNPQTAILAKTVFGFCQSIVFHEFLQRYNGMASSVNFISLQMKLKVKVVSQKELHHIFLHQAPSTNAVMFCKIKNIGLNSMLRRLKTFLSSYYTESMFILCLKSFF